MTDEEPELTPIESIERDLAWRGPRGNPLGHILLERAKAEELLADIKKLKLENSRLKSENADMREELDNGQRD